MVKEAEEGCRTPRHAACRIPAATACPPAPKKKPAAHPRRQRAALESGYFKPPDLELLFRVVPKREAIAWIPEL